MSELNLTTMNDVMLTVTSRGAYEAMAWQDGSGQWQAITSDALYGKVRALAAVFAGWGLGAGDRVVILSENRWEWAVTDMAALALGAADVPLYATTTTAEHVDYMINDSGAKVAVVSSGEQLAKIDRAACPALEHVVVMEPGEFAGAESFSKIMEAAKGLEGRDEAFDARAKAVKAEELATLIYTSGTTGQPKGVMLTHENLATNINVAPAGFDFHEGERSISFFAVVACDGAACGLFADDLRGEALSICRSLTCCRRRCRR